MLCFGTAIFVSRLRVDECDLVGGCDLEDLELEPDQSELLACCETGCCRGEDRQVASR